LTQGGFCERQAMSRDTIFRYIEAHLDSHVSKIQELVRQPSVSLEKQGLPECAELVRQHLAELGCQETALIDVGDAYPGVWARLDSGARKTILYYSHYDVRPVGQERWDWPPFGAELVEMPPYKRVLVGRGARGSKGPLQAWLNALQAIKAVEGKLPVNVLFLIEGAEILGSCNYLQLAEDQTTAALVKYPGKVAVLLLSFNEAVTILTQAEGYTHIYNNVKWYGADGTAASQGIIDDAGSQAVQLGLFSLMAQTPDSPEYQALGDRYTALTGQLFSTYTAYQYDAAFALAETVVSTESTDAGVVAAALPGFCKTYVGVSGNCALNVYGDRVPGPYVIWSYRFRQVYPRKISGEEADRGRDHCFCR